MAASRAYFPTDLTVEPATSSETVVTSLIQAALTRVHTSGAGRVTLRPGYTYTIDSSLTIYPNTTLDARGATISLAAGSACRMLTGSSFTPYKTATGSATETQYTITGVSGLQASDIGSWVELLEAGGTGPPKPGGGTSGTASWHGRITNVSGTTITVDTACPASVSNKTVKFYTALSDVTLLGGTWDRQAGNDYLGHTIYLPRCERLHINGVSVITRDSKYAIFIPGVFNSRIENVYFDVDSDGLHINGPAKNVVVDGISGSTGDDVVPLLCASEYAGDGSGFLTSPYGPIADTVVRNVNVDTVANSIKITSWVGCKPDNITCDTIAGTVSQFAAVIGQWPEGSYSGTDPLGTIILRNFNVTTGSGYCAVDIRSAAIDGITLERVKQGNAAETVKMASASRIVVRDCISAGVLASLSAAASLSVENCVVTTGSAQGVKVLSGASGAVVRVAGGIWDCTGGYGVYLLDSCKVHLDAPTALTSQLVYLNASGKTVYVTGTVSGPASGALFIISLGTMIVGVDTRGCPSVTNAWSIGGGTLRATSLGCSGYVNQLTNTAGDMAYNTNSGLGCGTGPVIANGTLWKHLYTGSTT